MAGGREEGQVTSLRKAHTQRGRQGGGKGGRVGVTYLKLACFENVQFDISTTIEELEKGESREGRWSFREGEGVRIMSEWERRV